MDEQSKTFADGQLTIWIVDDHPKVHETIQCTMEDAGWNVVLESFFCCEDAIKKLELNTAPEVILQDISIPGKMSGIQALDVYGKKNPETKVIMFTVHEDDVYVLESIRRGAKGYFTKSSRTSRVLDAIEDAMNGLLPIDSHVAGKVLSYLTLFPDMHQETNLTPREMEILHLLVGKKTRAEIARELCISESTVKHQIGSIYAKLQVHTRTEAVLLAVKKHII
ncbi:MAG: response regulator transcription factor [Ignavibacteriae bacterium]|nr:response regulator transcription factor [Ignavibacteriota bacterium]